MNKRIQRLEDGLLVMLYDDDPDSPGDELIVPSDNISQDEHYPEYAHLKPGESIIIKENPIKPTSGYSYPSGYEDLDEFLNSDPGAIDRLVQHGVNKQTIKSYENLADTRNLRWYVYLRRTVLDRHSWL